MFEGYMHICVIYVWWMLTNRHSNTNSSKGKGTQPSGTTSQGRKPKIPMESIQSAGESEIPGNHKISGGWIISQSGWGKKFIAQAETATKATLLGNPSEGYKRNLVIRHQVPNSPRRSHLLRRKDRSSAEGESGEHLNKHTTRGWTIKGAPEEEDTVMPGIWTNVLPCWGSYHPWESTEDLLSILLSLWMFTLFKKQVMKNSIIQNNDIFSIKTCKTFVE